MPERTRDIRIDFWRGVALLAILITHCEFSSKTRVLAHITACPFGLSTFAELFVFVSGFVCGLVYQESYSVHGYWKTQFKALHRAWQLYFYNIFVFAIVAAISLSFTIYPDVPRHMLIASFSLDSFTKVALLRDFPELFDILPLYISLLVALVPFLALLRYGGRNTLFISLIVYASANLVFKLAHDSLPFTNWEFNPFSWQLLFFIGVVLGVGWLRGQTSIKTRRIYLIMSLILLGVVFFVEKLMPYLVANHIVAPLERLSHLMPMKNRVILGPPLLLHFLLLAYVFDRLLPASHRFWRTKFVMPFVLCGRNSLQIFSFGIILGYLALYVMQTAADRAWAVALVDLSAVLLSILFACFLEWKKGLLLQIDSTSLQKRAHSHAEARACDSRLGLTLRSR